MKTIATLSVLLISTQISFAQDSKLWLSLGAGIHHASNENKANLIGNGFNLQADAFVPFYRKGWDGTVKGGSFTLGVNVLGNYASIQNLSPDNSTTQNQYQLFNGTLAVASSSASKTSASFAGLVGLQARFSLGKFNLSPSLNTGYLHFKKAGYEQIGSTSINGQTRQLALISAEDQSSGGLVFKPQVRVGYNLTSSLSVFLSPAMIIGHEVAHTVQQRVPQGGFNERNTYEASQLANGTWESKTSTSRYQFTEMNFGLSVAIGKKKPKQNVKPGGAVSSSYAAGRLSTTPTVTQKAEAQDFNTTRSNRDNRSSTHPDSVVTQTGNDNQPALKGINNNNSMPNRLSMTPTTVRQSTAKGETTNPIYSPPVGAGENPLFEGKTTISTPKQSQGQNFGEKVATGLQSGASAVGQGASLLGGALGNSATHLNSASQPLPGQPIGGIVVKGGKNPGGNLITTTTNEKGEFGFVAAEAGNYQFSLLMPAEAQDFNTTRSNRERGQLAAGSGTAGASANPVKAEAQDFNTTRNNKERGQLVAAPGNPIGGIIVKGGKNPGGNLISVTTNANGEVTFENLAAGSYLFQVTTSNQPAAKTGGRAYTGGRKNEVQGKSISEKGVSGSKPKAKTKVKEKATSGLKDTLKTNV